MSIVTDELEDAVLAALPGATPAENAEYLRELAYRLTLTAHDLDPEPAATATPNTADAASVLVTGNPVDGIRLTGPFPPASTPTATPTRPGSANGGSPN
jgi:hypothetical protein